ncbi:MAG: hypothetical protein Q7K35_03000 [bacterium]|nr:hypothetical protein [bacterium]
MPERPEEQLDFFNRTDRQPAQKNGAVEAGAQKRDKMIPPIFKPEDIKKIFGENEIAPAGESEKTTPEKNVREPRSHPRKMPLNSAEKSLGWAGRYWGNNPDDSKQ